ncbi:MAG: 2-hydroxyacyl-CoA dehydratase [Blautia sp.]|nr:2-hydroxyacyl-CoA dehydratase [Blautia sp.]
MNLQELLDCFHEVAHDPGKQMKKYLDEGKKVVLVAPVYTPEEVIHSMGMVPMGAWGGDIQLNEAKKYFPAFICSIMQSIVELGTKGVYDGASAIVIPSLCDSLKVLGQNWKYAVKDIPFIPMTYPQNRKPAFGRTFTKAGYERVAADLEKATGIKFEEDKLPASIDVYNAHNAAMRAVSEKLASHPEITNQQRSDIFKSATFMLKEEHTELVNALLAALDKAGASAKKTIRIMTSGILADAPDLLTILDENNMQIVADDVAAESRQYRTDTPDGDKAPLERLADKFAETDNCSVLYDVEKKRVDKIVEDAKKADAKGVLVLLTKFCDPEEFDYPLIKRACSAADLPCVLIEIDRQMVNYEQARTAIETFKDLLA